MNIYKDPSKKKNNKKETEQPVAITFDLQSLNLFCMYVVSENSYIRSSHIAMMRKLFERIDVTRYQNDSEKLIRLEFIKRGLDGRVVKKIRNRDMLMKYVNGGFSDKPLINTNFGELSSEEIEWINETMSESLKHAFMYDYIDEIMDVCARFKAEDYSRKGTIVSEFENIVDRVKKEFRRVKNESLSEMEFTLADGIFEEVMCDVYARESNPSRRLKTGMQGFNELVGGGLESQRTYMLFGMAGSGKSLTMLNIAYQIKKYNRNYQCKDKTKKPCIAILTMENSVHETVTRLFSIITGDRMTNYTIDEVIEKLRTDGELVLNDESPIDIFIKFKPNLSIDTTYLYTLYDDLLDRGYEMICLMQDHVKRIRPAFPRHDMRLDLGEVVNDFKTFAIEKDIPVISDSHLNRDGARIIDSAQSANKQDATKLLGRSNVGESMLMIDNVDCAIIINKEYDRDGKEYMIFFRQKMRDQASKRDYIAHPFAVGSTIRLVEDLLDPIPAFRESLYEPTTMNRGDSNSNVRMNDYSGNIRNLDDDDDGLFNKKTKNMPQVYSTGMVPETIQLSTMNFDLIGGPSVPVYQNYQNPVSSPIQETGFFDQPTGVPQGMVHAIYFDEQVPF